jgi:hypothetical protein
MEEIALGDDGLSIALGDDIALGGPDDPGTPTSVDEAELLAREELTEVLDGFKRRAAREEQRFADAADSEYWVALCFQTRAQKEEFLRTTGWGAPDEKYLDGMAVADALDITLDAGVPPEPLLRIDRRLRELT